jgi:hypothetical protein
MRFEFTLDDLGARGRFTRLFAVIFPRVANLPVQPPHAHADDRGHHDRGGEQRDQGYDPEHE